MVASDTRGRWQAAAQSAMDSSVPATKGSNFASAAKARTPLARSFSTAALAASDSVPPKNTPPYSRRATSSMCNSITVVSSRTLARASGAFGNSGLAGQVSSRYSRIAEDSHRRTPSISAYGTLPIGLSAR